MSDRNRPSPPRILTAWLAAFALGVGGFVLAGCGADDGATTEPPAGSAAAEPDAADSAAVELEPAYPEEVSPEGLTAEDVRQQEMPHSHDGEAHAHDGEAHAHDGEAHAHDGEDHAHDRGEDHHDHDEDGHAH